MIQHVLVPYDGSSPAKKALGHAVENFPDAEITVLRVIVPEDYDARGPTSVYGYQTTDPDDLEYEFDRAKERAETSLEEAVDDVDSDGATVEAAVWVGPVVRTILEFTEENDVDQIVIGSHGRTGLSRVLLGSVAEKVARRSPVPVTIAR